MRDITKVEVEEVVRSLSLMSCGAHLSYTIDKASEKARKHGLTKIYSLTFHRCNDKRFSLATVYFHHKQSYIQALSYAAECGFIVSCSPVQL